jgi:regulator of nucleoside diphosphate kinase
MRVNGWRYCQRCFTFLNGINDMTMTRYRAQDRPCSDMTCPPESGSEIALRIGRLGRHLNKRLDREYRECPAMKNRQIIITAEDYEQLEALLKSRVVRVVNGSDRLDELQTELGRAQIIPQDDVPRDVVTMNSTVSLRDLGTNEVETYTLVFPECADIANHKLSVLAPIGTAVLGYRLGDEFRWRVPGGWRTLKIEQVIFQPGRDGALRI